MSRAASPLKDDRTTKRSRPSLGPGPDGMPQLPDNVVDIVSDGDAFVVLSGMSTDPKTPIGLRVSTHALSLASPVFKASFAAAAIKASSAKAESPPQVVVTFPEDDGDAMFILCNILHLRNDKLPARILPELLWKIALFANKYDCVVATGRATLQWFDHLYASKSPVDLWKVIEAAYILDEPMFFARFTSRYVLQQPMAQRTFPKAASIETQKLAAILVDRHATSQTLLRNELEALVETCAFVLSKQAKHYIDWAPGMSPDADETPSGKPPVECRCDQDGAVEYLGALRDAHIWPSTVWNQIKHDAGSGATIDDVINELKYFKEPEYNDADRCEFCENVKISFTETMDVTKDAQADRLWGLCLDCYKAGGINAGECRFEHAKAVQPARAVSASTTGS